ncbi:MAG: glycosyltransferase [Planctomycetota bacterium]|jgi:glycosyltransferase involved in cell wall biosynthesis
MRLLLFGNHAAGDGYPRLAVIAEGLRRHGVEVHEVRVPLLEGEGQRTEAASSVMGLLGAAARAGAGMLRLSSAYRDAPDHDAVLVGYPGHAAVRVARRANRDGRRPVLLDAFLSLHDTIVNDRGLAPPGSVRARALHRADRVACKAADRVLVDTNAHGDFFHEDLGVPRERLRRILVGSMTGEVDAKAARKEDALEVLWFGTYVPLQGVSVILEAAALLKGRNIRFTMLGRGQELEQAREQARELGLGEDLLHWIEDFVPREELDQRMAETDVCLGIFGTTDKAARVVPCKVYDALAAARPLVTADTPAAREILVDGESAVLVPRGDARALADALLRLKEQDGLRETLRLGARRLHGERLTPERVVEGLVRELWPVGESP